MTNKTNVETIELSSIRYYAGYMPIDILTNDEGMEVGYLSPFRGYAFQVSETFDGQWDLGSTEVFGLNNLLDGRLGTERRVGYQSNLRMDSVKAYFLSLAAKEAIQVFCQNTWRVTKEHGVETVRVFCDTPCETFLGDGRKLPRTVGATMIERFTALCIKWLNPELYAVYTQETTPLEVQQRLEYYQKKSGCGR